MQYYCVMLTSVGDKKVQTIKALRDASGMGLAEAKGKVENAPCKLVGGLTEEQAHLFKNEINLLGNWASVERDYDAMSPNLTFKINGVSAATSANMNVNNSYSDPYSDLYSNSSNNDNYYNDPYNQGYSDPYNNQNANQNYNQNINQANNPYNTSTYTSSYTYNPYYSTNNTEKKKSGGNVAALICCLVVICVSVISGLLVYVVAKSVPKNNRNHSYDVTQDGNIYYGGQDAQYGNAELDDSVYDSIVLNYLAYDAFGKDLRELSEKELKQVVYIDFNWDGEHHVEMLKYKLKDGTEGIITTPREYINFDYFALFPNLEYIDSRYINFRSTGRIQLDKLEHLGFEPDITVSISSKLDTSDITSLTEYIGIYSANLSEFPKLEELKIVDDFGAINFEAMKDAENLRSLCIESDYYNLDITGLTDLVQLESLYIKCESIKDVRFIEKLPNLKVFGLEDSKVINIESVEKLAPNLEELYLIGNYSVDDYTFIGELTNLKKLGLVDWFTDDTEAAGFPDISNLTNLEELTIGKTEDLSALYNLTGLKKLVLEGPYDNDFGFLLNMPELTELHVHNGSLYSSEIYTIAKCTSVEDLCLYYTFVWDDLSPALNMPNLKRINLLDASFGLMVDRVLENHTLEYIGMEYGRVYSLDENGEWFWDNEVIGLSEVSGVFSKLKALKEVSVPSQDLQDVECFADNDNLTFLNIDGSYVVDLTPLKGKPLKHISCYSTQIYEYAGFDDVIFK